MSDLLLVQVVEAEQSLFRYVLRQFHWQSLISEAAIKEISDTGSQEFEHEAVVGAIRTIKLELVEDWHDMPRARLLRSNGGQSTKHSRFSIMTFSSLCDGNLDGDILLFPGNCQLRLHAGAAKGRTSDLVPPTRSSNHPSLLCAISCIVHLVEALRDGWDDSHSSDSGARAQRLHRRCA